MSLQKYKSRHTQQSGNRHTKRQSLYRMKQALMRSRIHCGTQQRTYGMQRIRQNTFPVRNVQLPRLNRQFDRCPNYAIIAFALSISRNIVNRPSTAGDTMLTQKHRQLVWHKSRPSLGMNVCRHTKQRKKLVKMSYHGLRINTGTRKSERKMRILVNNC